VKRPINRADRSISAQKAALKFANVELTAEAKKDPTIAYLASEALRIAAEKTDAAKELVGRWVISHSAKVALFEALLLSKLATWQQVSFLPMYKAAELVVQAKLDARLMPNLITAAAVRLAPKIAAGGSDSFHAARDLMNYVVLAESAVLQNHTEEIDKYIQTEDLDFESQTLQTGAIEAMSRLLIAVEVVKSANELKQKSLREVATLLQGQSLVQADFRCHPVFTAAIRFAVNQDVDAARYLYALNRIFPTDQAVFAARAGLSIADFGEVPLLSPELLEREVFGTLVRSPLVRTLKAAGMITNEKAAPWDRAEYIEAAEYLTTCTKTASALNDILYSTALRLAPDVAKDEADATQELVAQDMRAALLTALVSFRVIATMDAEGYADLSILELAKLVVAKKVDPAVAATAMIGETIKLSIDITGWVDEDVTPEFITAELDAITPDYLRQQCRTALLRALKQAGILSNVQVAKLTDDRKIGCAELAERVRKEADHIPKSVISEHVLLAKAIALAPQIVAGSEHAMRELVGVMLNQAIRRHMEDEDKIGNAKKALASSKFGDREFDKKVKQALLKGLVAIGKAKNPEDPRFLALSIPELAAMLVGKQALDPEHASPTALAALRLAERIAQGDEDAARELVAIDKVAGSEDAGKGHAPSNDGHYSDHLKDAIVDALLATGIVSSREQCAAMTTEQASKLLAASQRLTANYQQNRSTAEVQQAIQEAELKLKRQIEAIVVLSHRIKVLGGEADPSQPAGEAKPVNPIPAPPCPPADTCSPYAHAHMPRADTCATIMA
jgi:hypothetical protein